LAASGEDGTPQLVSERACSAVASGFAIQRRRRAFLGDVFDKVTAKGDFRAKLEKQAMEDPKGFLDWLGRQLPADPVQSAPGAAGGTLNIQALFLAAARGEPLPGLPAPGASLPIVDAEAVPVERDDW